MTDADSQRLERLEAGQQRVEAMLRQLLDALTDSIGDPAEIETQPPSLPPMESGD